MGIIKFTPKGEPVHQEEIEKVKGDIFKAFLKMPEEFQTLDRMRLILKECQEDINVREERYLFSLQMKEELKRD